MSLTFSAILAQKTQQQLPTDPSTLEVTPATIALQQKQNQKAEPVNNDPDVIARVKEQLRVPLAEALKVLGAPGTVSTVVGILNELKNTQQATATQAPIINRGAESVVSDLSSLHSSEREPTAPTLK